MLMKLEMIAEDADNMKEIKRMLEADKLFSLLWDIEGLMKSLTEESITIEKFVNTFYEEKLASGIDWDLYN